MLKNRAGGQWGTLATPCPVYILYIYIVKKKKNSINIGN